MHKVSRIAVLAAITVAVGAHAQSSCSSDGVRPPAALLERFISADCATCWADEATPKAARSALAIDWVLPGSRGEDAPLAAVASRDALERQQALHRAPSPTAEEVRVGVARNGRRLRVAHGLAFNGYIGASIEFQSAGGGPWSAWLLLVETLPVGTEGSPVERNLVRNALHLEWHAGKAPRQFESRSMSIPEGSKSERLRVVGWVEDASGGRMVAAAQSRCRH